MNKSVLVTGGAKGIGRAIVEKFARCGYNVLINYLTSEKEARNLKNKINKECPNVKVEIYKADVSSKKEIKSMIQYMIENFNSIDVLVNNSGISSSKLFTDITYEEYKKMFDINVYGAFNVSQEVINSYMLNKKNGVILNISSIWGVCGASMETLYSSSKAAVIGMSKALAKEMGPSNIRVNVVNPGWIETDMTKGFLEEDKNEFKEKLSLNRLGTVDDVANLVYFISSDEASYITGQVINVDGGYLM